MSVPSSIGPISQAVKPALDWTAPAVKSGVDGLPCKRNSKIAAIPQSPHQLKISETKDHGVLAASVSSALGHEANGTVEFASLSPETCRPAWQEDGETVTPSPPRQVYSV